MELWAERRRSVGAGGAGSAASACVRCDEPVDERAPSPPPWLLRRIPASDLHDELRVLRLQPVVRPKSARLALAIQVHAGHGRRARPQSFRLQLIQRQPRAARAWAGAGPARGPAQGPSATSATPCPKSGGRAKSAACHEIMASSVLRNHQQNLKFRYAKICVSDEIIGFGSRKEPVLDRFFTENCLVIFLGTRFW